jgi:hypothetical protein
MRRSIIQDLEYQLVLQLNMRWFGLVRLAYIAKQRFLGRTAQFETPNVYNSVTTPPAKINTLDERLLIWGLRPFGPGRPARRNRFDTSPSNRQVIDSTMPVTR